MKIIKYLNELGYNLLEDNSNTDAYFLKHKVKITEILRCKPEISTLKEISDILKIDQSFKSTAPLEKYINLYGTVVGTEKFNSKKPHGITLERMIEKYGEEEGKLRFDSYRKKQAYSNSFEYKKQKNPSLTIEEFDEYNSSRAVTLKNLTKKYGEEEGKLRFDSYRKKQAYTNTKEYLGERYEQINLLKSHTLESYIIRFGSKELAEKHLLKYYSNSKNFYSKKSQKFCWQIFNEILNDEEKEKTYFAELNKEYAVFFEDRVFLYDLVISKLNLCIEFHGDHYHGNPKIYHPSEKLRGRGQTTKTAAEIWKTDAIKENAITKLRNYEYICIWESDYDNKETETLNKVRDKIIEKRALI